MNNPMLQALNSNSNNNSLLSALKDPNKAFNNLMQSNPQFKAFVDANRGKSAEQIARENGIDPSMLKLFR